MLLVEVIAGRDLRVLGLQREALLRVDLQRDGQRPGREVAQREDLAVAGGLEDGRVLIERERLFRLRQRQAELEQGIRSHASTVVTAGVSRQPHPRYRLGT